MRDDFAPTRQRCARAFQFAFDNIKPTDGVIVGMYPRFFDEITADAQYAASWARLSNIRVGSACRAGPGCGGRYATGLGRFTWPVVTSFSGPLVWWRPHHASFLRDRVSYLR